MTSSFWISGVCGSGKSTLAVRLKQILPTDQFDVHDFDERGVPFPTPACWRPEETGHWHGVASENARQGRTTIICGATHADEIVASTPTHLPMPRLCLLETSHEDIARRLAERFKNPVFRDYLYQQSGQSPEDLIEEMRLYAPQLRELFQRPEYRAIFLDTSAQTHEQTVVAILAWIRSDPPGDDTVARVCDDYRG